MDLESELDNNCGNSPDLRWAIHLYLHNGCHKILREKSVIKLLVCKLTINIGYWLTCDIRPQLGVKPIVDKQLLFFFSRVFRRKDFVKLETLQLKHYTCVLTCTVTFLLAFDLFCQVYDWSLWCKTGLLLAVLQTDVINMHRPDVLLTKLVIVIV